MGKHALRCLQLINIDAIRGILPFAVLTVNLTGRLIYLIEIEMPFFDNLFEINANHEVFLFKI